MRFLLDENLEHEVAHRLRNYGHDVVHVTLDDEISTGASDTELALFSRENGYIIVTYDDDFRDDVSEDEYRAVLYLPDQTLATKKIADVLHEISTYYRERDLQGFTTVGRSWL